MSKVARKKSGDIFSKVVAVVTALSLVFLQVPISGLSKGNRAEAANSAREQLAERSAIEVPLEFEHAYIVYDGQVIASPATKVALPAQTALKFKAEADNGYQLESVKATVDGTEVRVEPDTSNDYKLSADEVVTTSKIVVRAITAPEVMEGGAEAVAQSQVEAPAVGPEDETTEEPAQSTAAEKPAASEASDSEAAQSSGQSQEADGDEDAGEGEENGDSSDSAEAGGSAGQEEAEGLEETEKAEEPKEPVASASSSEGASQSDGSPSSGESDTAEADGEEHVELPASDADSNTMAVSELSDADAVAAGAVLQSKRAVSATQATRSDASLQALMNDLGDVSAQAGAVAIDSDNATVDFGIYRSSTDRANRANVLAAGDEIAIDDMLYGLIHYEFKADEGPKVGRLIYTYTLPDNIDVQDKAPTTLFDDSYNEAGAWEIKDGVVYFYYDEAWAKKHPNGGGFFSFDFRVEEEKTETGSDTTLSFPGATDTITVNVKGGDLTGSKSNAGIDPDGYVTYTVNLHSQQGFPYFQFTDKLDDGFDYVAGSFTFDGAPVNATIAQNADGSTTATAALSSISKGDHVIIYRAKLDQDLFSKLSNWGSIGANNVATWKFGNDAGDARTHYATSYVWAQKNTISKSSNGVTSDGKASWTVTINGSNAVKTDLAGYTFTDTLGAGHAYGGGYVILDENYETFATGRIDAGATSFTYTFPGNAGAKTYYVKYSTVLDDTTQQNTVSNSASLTPPDGTPTTTENTVTYYPPSDDGDAGGNPGGSAGTTAPQNLDVTKEVLDSSQATTTGTVSWHSVLTVNNWPEIAGGTGYLEFYDDTWNSGNNQDWNNWVNYATLWHTGTPTLSAGGTALVAGVDYEIVDASENCIGMTATKTNYKGETVSEGLRIRFNTESDTMKSVIENHTPIDIYYTTMCDGTHATYKNKAYAYREVHAYGGVYTDFNNEAEDSYTIEGKPGVVKKNVGMYLDHERGKWVAEWQVLVNGGNNTVFGDLKSPSVRIVDTLPEGMTYIADSEKTSFIRAEIDGNGLSYWSTNDTECPGYAPAISQDGTELTFEYDFTTAYDHWGSHDSMARQLADGTWANSTFITLTFKTELDSAHVVRDGSEQTLYNSAVADAGGVNLGMGSAQAHYTDSVIKKEGHQEDGVPVVHYTISVNESGQKLDSEDSHAAITLNDKLDVNSTVLLSSIRVTNKTTGEDITGSCPVAYDDSLVDEDGNPTSSFSVRVPDSTWVTIEYNVLLSGSVGEQVEVTNTASLNGITSKETQSKSRYEVRQSDAGVYGSATKLLLTKSDADDVVNKQLGGAEFTLYRVDMSKLPDGSFSDDQLAAASTTMFMGVTDEEGSLFMGEPEGTGLALATDTLYYFKETKAPAGYQLDDAVHYVMVKGNDYADQLSVAKSHGITPSQTVVYNVTDQPEDEVETIDVSGTKKWDDANDQDGKRPASITVNLLANGAEIDERVVVAAPDGTWSYSFADLPKYDENGEIAYTVTEDAVPGYTARIDGFDITNKHAPETTSVGGKKTWNDGGNQDGKRPSSITVRLYNGTKEVAHQDVSESDGWTYRFENLPKYAHGRAIVYTVTEDEVAGYTTSVSGTNITNTYKPETTSVDVTKRWNDADNQDGVRPSQVTVQLYADGVPVAGKTATLSAANNWTDSFTDLPKYNNGAEIAYTVDEETVDGYSKQISGSVSEGFTVTNARKPETTIISGTKSWQDDSNADGNRPTSVTIRLLADGEEVATQVATEDGGWKYEFKDLPVYREGASGQKVSYTVSEAGFADYVASVVKGGLINTYAPEYTSVSVKKSWDDADDEDGLRPASVTVNLLANGSVYDSVQLNAAASWSYTWGNLPKRLNGEDVVYTVGEEAVAGYEAPEIAGNAAEGFTITNKRTVTPSTELVIYKVSAADYSDLSGARFELASVSNPDKTQTATTGADGTARFKKLKKGESYTLKEVLAPGGFRLDGTVYRLTVADNDDMTITCDDPSISIWGSKATGFMAMVADQPDGEYGSIVLHKNLYGAEGMWSNTNEHPELLTVRSNIKIRVENVDTGDYVEFTGIGRAAKSRRIDVLNSSGSRIGQVIVVPTDAFESRIDNLPSGTWKVTELADGITDFTGASAAKNGAGDEWVRTTTYSVAGGTTQLIGTSSVNPPTMTIDNTYYHKGGLVLTKEFGWDYDNLPGTYAGNQLGESATKEILSHIVFTLTGQGTGEVYTIRGSDFVDRTAVQVASASGNTAISVSFYNRQWTIANLPYDTYTLVEESDGYCDGDKEIDTILHKFYTTGAFKVTKDAATTNVSVGDTTGTRGESGVSETGTSVEVNSSDAKVNVLNVYYRPKVVETTKTWNIPAGLDYTPGDIDVQLVRSINGADNAGIAQQGYYYPVTAADVPEHPGYVTRKTLHWNESTKSYDKVVFANLPAVTANGEQITYEVREVRADGSLVQMVNGQYSDSEGTVLTQGNDYIDADGATAFASWGDGWKIAKNPYTEEDGSKQYYSSTKGLTIANTMETTEVSGQKTWDDADDQDGKRPTSITVRLFNGDKEVASKQVTAADNWAYAFKDLPAYENGEEITYTVAEDAVDGYEAEVAGTNIVNTHVPEKTTVRGSKTWDDADDQDGKRPTSITVRVWNGSVEVASKTVRPDASGSWSYEFTGLDKYANGRRISYTVTEDAVAEYTTTYDGANIVNAHTPETTAVSGTKTWDDADNQDGKRPTSIAVNLLADGEKVESVTVAPDDEGTWSYAFENLPKYKDGVEIAYTVSEEEVAGYTTSYSGTDIVNSYETETTEVAGTKIWDDANNQDGKRPASVTVRLLANGNEVDSATVSEATGWTYAFTDLPAYENGNRITYTVTEDAVASYTTTMNGFDIKNTHKPEMTSVSGAKVWDDADNQDGKRPTSITVNLLADGVKVNSRTIVPDADGNWPGFTFANLPVYQNGQRVTYTLSENAVAGYEESGIAFPSGMGALIRNTHVPETTQVAGVKTWEDNGDQDGKRPTSITVNLLADGEQVDSVVATAANNWKYEFGNLPKYKAGHEIAYSVSEDPVEGYDAEIDGADMTNTHIPEKTSVKVVKAWNDQDDYDGLRPNAVAVQLYADGDAYGSAVTLDESTEWEHTWYDLDKYRDKKEISYTVAEVDGGNTTAYTMTDPVYSESLGAFVITNTHEVEKVTVKGVKTWSDNDDQDGKRPSQIIVDLLANGGKVAEKKVTPDENGDWNYSFTNLDKYDGGKEIAYTVTEEQVEGYTASISGNAADGFVIDNAYTPEETEVTVAKEWVDADDQDGIRPKSLKVRLLADGEPVSEEGIASEVALNAGNGWTYTWTGLARYASGNEIQYSVEEDAVPNYTAALSGSASGGFTFENAHVPNKVDVKVDKVWDDANDQDGKRAEGVEVRLNATAAGEAVALENVTTTVTLDEENGWHYEWTDLPERHGGTMIEYSLSEVAAIDGYTTKVTSSHADATEDVNASTMFTVTNAHTPELVNIPGKKTWNDKDNQDGKRPASVTVRLLANGNEVAEAVVTEDDGWAYVFENQPKYANGEEIEYAVVEDAVPEYEASYEGFDVVNTHLPEKTAVRGSKSWDDADDQDGKRPSSVTVRVWDGQTEVASTSVKPDSAGNWSYEFTGLDKYANGEEISYTVTEDMVAGYTTEVDGTAIRNTHVPETVEVSGAKTWIDNEDQDGKRPDSITVNLLADGAKVADAVVEAGEDGAWRYSFAGLPKYANGKEISYTVSEEEVAGYTVSYDGAHITNSYETETTEISGSKTWDDANDQDGKRPSSVTVRLHANGSEIDNAVVTSANGWEYSFKGLPVYEGGKKITYTVTEDEVPGYTTLVAGYNVKNTHVPETTEVSGSKTWDDANDQDGKRPESITVNLLADGAVIDSRTLVPDAAGAWPPFSFTDLPVYKNGVKISYTVSEDAVAHYETAIDGTSIVNSHPPETTEVSGSKTWDDANDQDGKRPESITLNLLANGEQVDSMTVKPAADGSWTYAFRDLPKFKSGREIAYSITEAPVSGYETVVDGFNVKNSHVPEKTSVKVVKEWNDQNDYDGLRPNAVKVQLYANGVAKGDAVTLNAASGWDYTWTNLDKYANGKEIAYTVAETDNGGSSAYTTTAPSYDSAKNSFVITNAHEVVKVSVGGTKKWSDNENQDGKRPASVTVDLLANGSKLFSQVVKADASGDWKFSFTDLDKYAGGKEIVYSVAEEQVEGYSATITGDAASGFTIENAYTPEKTEVSVEKIWDDADNQDGIRPDDINVRLKNGPTTVDAAVLNASNNWSYTWTDLDRYAGGAEIAYTVEEDAVTDYSAELSGSVSGGFKIKNTHAPLLVDVEVDKVWNDADDQDGKRADDVSVHLVAKAGEEEVVLEGVETTVTLNEANRWHHEWKGLPQKHDGTVIAYALSEVGTTDGYATSVTSSQTAATETANSIISFAVTNTHTPELTSVPASKAWNDEGDQDGKRPAALIVQLFAGDDPVLVGGAPATAVLNQENDWSTEWTGLPKYAGGTEIDYRVVEIAVPADYEKDADGVKENAYTLQNRHDVETTNVSAKKVWNDANNQDGMRGSYVTVELFANGTKVESGTLNADNGWFIQWSDLPKYANGSEVDYTLTETPESVPSGYDEPSVAKASDGDGISFTVTNAHAPETVDVRGLKTWNDADDQDRKRPAAIVVNLLANGAKVDAATVTPDADGNWAYAFDGLPKYASGSEIAYTVTEEAVDGYTTVIDGYDITNSYKPGETDVKVVKVWNDADNQDGVRPDYVKVQLYADGSEKGEPVALSESNSWTYTWEGLAQKAAGVDIVYTVAEVETDVWAANYEISQAGNATSGYTITNAHAPEKTSAQVTKEWRDADNQDGKRAPSIEVQLLANGEPFGAPVTLNVQNGWTFTWADLDKKANGVDIAYTLAEVSDTAGYDKSVDSTGFAFTVTNTHEVEYIDIPVVKTWDDAGNQDGLRPGEVIVKLMNGASEVASATLNADNNWSGVFEHLPKYANGSEINYTLQEVAVDGYTSTVTGSVSAGFSVKNAHTPEVTTARVAKEWDDANNQDGKRVPAVSVQLLANDGAYGNPVTLSAANNWTYQWENLPAKQNGSPVDYSVTELSVPDDYTASYSGDREAGFVVKNSYTPGVRNVTVSKAWSDAGNQDGKRPGSVMVRLLADGVQVNAEGVVAEVELSEDNHWTHTWENLDQMNAGKEIAYTVEEVDVPEGYTATTAGSADAGYLITNAHAPVKTKVEAAKQWNDDDDRDGKRPEGVTLVLYANGEEVATHAVQADARGNWSYTFEDLPKYAAGSEIGYTVGERAVKDYTGSVDGLTVTNAHDNEKTTVSGVKTWSDNGNQDGIRPDSITVRLLADGVEVDSRNVTEADDWSYEFDGLNKYRDGGTEIHYTVTEDDVAGYTTEVDGFNLENTFEVGGLSVTKSVANTESARSFDFTVTLDNDKVNGEHGGMTFANGVATFKLADGESAVATDLPAGVGYTVTEADAAGYTATMTGATGTVKANEIAAASVTNTYNATGMAEFFAMKTLNGRTLGPDEFTFELSEDGTVFQEVKNAGDGHARFDAITYTLADLGEHSYTIREIKGSAAGVTYDESRHTFTTNVTDNGDGTLNVAYGDYNPEEGVTFENSYAPSGSVVLQAKKTVDGRNPAAGAYEFTVADLQGRVYATAKNAADGTVTFPALNFKAAGTYEYVISEVIDDEAQTLGPNKVFGGVAYDQHKTRVTVKAYDNFDGTMRFETTYEGDEASFENTSVPDAAFPLEATKAVSGRDFKAGDEFTFSVEPSDGAPAPERSEVTIRPTSGTEASVDFGDITFTTDDLGKTYTYTISEAHAGETVDGLTNDPFAHWVKLTVIDAGDGTMGVTAEYEENAEGVVFTNSYAARGEAILTASKQLSGRALADGEFFFELTGDKLPAALHASASADGTIEFAPIEFTQVDVNQDFHYTMKEVQGMLGGVTYDTNSYDVTVHVADNGDGTLAVTYDYGESASAPLFLNSYVAQPTTAQLTAHKALVGGTLAGGEYEFTLTGTSENAASTSQTAKNDADGKVAFDELTYDKAGVYEYRIAEVVPAGATDNGDGTFTGADGVVYDGAEHVATVTVTDDGRGALAARVSYDDGASGISFGNTALVRTGFTFNKYYFGGVGSFDFTLTAVDASGSARAGESHDYSSSATIVDDGSQAFTATVQNGPFDGNVARIVFPEISFTADGDYYYLIGEDEPSTAEMMADSATYLAHVVVSGSKVVSTTFELLYEGENLGVTDDLSFYNNEAVTLDFQSVAMRGYTTGGERTSVYPVARKYLNGATDQLVGDDFTFELVDDESGTVLATATNDESGNIAFFDENVDPGLAYDKAGTYRYTIREVAGEEAGMIYDSSPISVTVVVSETADGLEATMTYNGPGGGEPAFYNVKQGMDVTVQKVSRSGGEGLADCTYALWMAGEDGDVLVQEAKSDANGFITFTDVSLMAGKKYYFKEVAAPKGHTVDPHRTAYFTLNATGDALVLAEKTASDGWHSATVVK